MHVPQRRRLARALLVPALATLLAAPLLPGGPQSARADSRDIRPDATGTAFAWGDNHFGQLGDGTTAGFSTVPGRVCATAPCTGPLQDVVSVATSGGHSLALRTDGTVVAWGDNFHGQLGDGTTVQRNTPVRVCDVGQSAPCTSFLGNVVALSTGGLHNLALKADGTVVAWGFNVFGELGNGTPTSPDVTIPVTVCAPFNCALPLDGIVAVAAGGAHSTALKSDGTVLTWGANYVGQLGDGTTTDRNTPVFACAPGETAPCSDRLDGITSLAAGGQHSLALHTDGTVVAWGDNFRGQLGDGTTTLSTTPALVCDIGTCATQLSGITAIAAGSEYSMALHSGGFVRSWGSNLRGELGDGTNTDRSLPVRVCAPGFTAPCPSHLSGITAIAAGGHSQALRTDGTLRAWGSNSSGRLGDGTTTDRNTPVGVCAPGQSAPCTRLLDGVTTAVPALALSRPAADVAVAVTAAPEPIANNAQLTYTVTVRNHGPAAAQGVVLTDKLPGAARFVSAGTSTGTCTTPPVGTSDTVTCALGTLAAGATATVTVTVRVVSAAGREITNPVAATSTTTDPRPDNNSAAITTPIS
ncbi:RCC1 domain-containing protein [Kitasatospora sp. NPDC054939]